MRSLFIALMLAHLTSAYSMESEVNGDTLMLSGPVSGNELSIIRDNSNVKTIILRNSLGGDGWTGIMLGEKFRDMGVKTIVHGYCMSACALMFLGGIDREIKGRLGFHGMTTIRDGVNTGKPHWEFSIRTAGYVEKMTEGKFSGDILKEVFYETFGNKMFVVGSIESCFEDWSKKPMEKRCIPQTAYTFGILKAIR